MQCSESQGDQNGYLNSHFSNLRNDPNESIHALNFELRIFVEDALVRIKDWRFSTPFLELSTFQLNFFISAWIICRKRFDRNLDFKILINKSSQLPAMIPSTEDVKSQWNAYSDLYSKKFEKNTFPFAISLSSMLQIFEEKPAKILEIASGPGAFSRYLSQNLDYECTVSAFDISEEMVSIAKSLATKYPSMPNVKVSYEVGNSEELTTVADESIDAYIANLCIHLTSSPEKMLQELKRVLKKGKRFGLSVLAPAERVTFVSTVPAVLKELEEEIPALKPTKVMRSPFHLGKREDLMKLVEEAGLEVDYCWYQQSGVNNMTLEDYEFGMLQAPQYKKLLEKLTEEERKRVVEAVRKKIKEAFIDKKEPSFFEALLLVGKKP